MKTDFKVLTDVRTDYENWNQKFFKKKKEQCKFSHENLNPVLWGLGRKMGRLDLGLGFKVLRFKAAPKTRETTKESKLIQKLGGFFFLLMCDFLCFFASCSVSYCFFVLHLFLASLMFHTFHLALLLVLCCYYLQ